MSKHPHYELLNLLGYGLAKFDQDFVKAFGFTSKDRFYQYFVELGLVETKSVVKNRMDLFDPFFDNPRKGWWQKGDAYRHRKDLIDSLFGQEDVTDFANIVKMYLKNQGIQPKLIVPDNPIVQSRFRKMQETGLEAELYFMAHYQEMTLFAGGHLEDGRLYGDGYDFQIRIGQERFLSEVKGMRQARGSLRLTQREYEQANHYKDRYVLSIVSQLETAPKLLLIANPLKELNFKKITKPSHERIEYHLVDKL